MLLGESLTPRWRRRVEPGPSLRQTRKALLVGTRHMLARIACLHRSLTRRLTESTPLGPDHQKIAKLDRENEVAPPAKVNASVGKVSLPYFVFFQRPLIPLCAPIGYPDRSYGEAAHTEGSRSKDQREALCHPGLRVRQGYPQSPNSLQDGEDLGCQTSRYVLSFVLSITAAFIFGFRYRHWEEAGGAKEVVM